MAELPTALPDSPPPSDPMRLFALTVTTYLWVMNLLYLVTRGGFSSPDHWGDLYAVVLAAYSGAPELKHLFSGTEPALPDSWQEKTRKGAPLIGLWLGLLLAAGAWRIRNPSWPMPPELKSITLQVIGVFFGTYTLRQYRRGKANRRGQRLLENPEGESLSERDAITNFLRTSGSSSARSISEAIGIPRRSLSRLLADLVKEGAILRTAASPTDPNATFRLP